jgi:KaiC
MRRGTPVRVRELPNGLGSRVEAQVGHCVSAVWEARRTPRGWGGVSFAGRLHGLSPTLVGGCRAIDLSCALDRESWRVIHHAVVSKWGIPRCSWPPESVNGHDEHRDLRMTLIMGPAGAGKSLLATHYAVGAAHRGERAAVYLFEEGTQSFIARAAGLGMNPHEYIKRNLLTVRQIDPVELTPSEFVHRVRESVERDHAGVVIIDSLNGYLAAMPTSVPSPSISAS